MLIPEQIRAKARITVIYTEEKVISLFDENGVHVGNLTLLSTIVEKSRVATNCAVCNKYLKRKQGRRRYYFSSEGQGIQRMSVIDSCSESECEDVLDKRMAAFVQSTPSTLTFRKGMYLKDVIAPALQKCGITQ